MIVSFLPLSRLPFAAFPRLDVDVAHLNVGRRQSCLVVVGPLHRRIREEERYALLFLAGIGDAEVERNLADVVDDNTRKANTVADAEVMLIADRDAGRILQIEFVDGAAAPETVKATF
ncbi:MAG: hypothetical protein R3E51_10460 [Rhizobiaceae bacterium]